MAVSMNAGRVSQPPTPRLPTSKTPGRTPRCDMNVTIQTTQKSPDERLSWVNEGSFCTPERENGVTAW